MKGKFAVALLCGSLVCFSVAGASCKETGGMEYEIVKTVSDGDVRVEICVKSLEGDAFLIDIMNKAKESGDLTFETVGTMVISIDGYANDIDYNPCWMLYTTDEELSNDEWGTITVGETVLGSAILGADALPVVEGEMYVWTYCEF